MEEFKKQLRLFSCKKGQTYTHTSIDNPKISLCVPEDKTDAFKLLYKNAIVQKIPLHLTEKPTDPSPMRIDLDFRFSMIDPRPPKDSPFPRIYTTAHVQKILMEYFKILYKYLDIPENNGSEAGAEAILTAYVMEKPTPVEYRGKIKDGIHVIWPHVVIPHSFQHLIRKQILAIAGEMFQGLSFTNTFDDIIDQAIIDKNNWQMYRSRKPDCEEYTVTQIYTYIEKTEELQRHDVPSLYDQLQLDYVQLFSMRKKEHQLVPFREDKQAEIDEYIRHVLPTMDDRRKNKLHSQIFGKTANLLRNFISDDELELARKLVHECLKQGRAESYEDWVKLGWTLRNIDFRLLDAWVDFSRVSSKYIEGECQKLWNQMRNDTLGMGTLRWWAREDNPMKYKEICDASVTDLIDKSIGTNGAHYDVAKVVHAMYKGQYRFVSKDTWYMYSDILHRWVRSREGLKLRNILSVEVCQKYMDRSTYWNIESTRSGVDDENKSRFQERSKKLMEIALKLKNTSYKSNIMTECKTLFTDEKFEEMLDAHPHIIGFENGVYDLRMHEFRDGLPDDYISFSTGRHYQKYDSKSTDAKEIEAYLSQVFTNGNVKKYVKDVFACSLDGGIRQEKFYIFTGQGSNSKSILLNLLQKSVGDYYCILPIALLTQKRTSSNSAQSELVRTKGRRMTVMQEPGENEKLNIGLMKELSGGDRILCRGLFQEPIEFKPQFKMFLTCNELPEVPSDDGGTWRRIRVVEFTSKFLDKPDPKNPKEFAIDPDLTDKLDRWSDIFISMLIDHHKELDIKNLIEPAEVRIATEGYKKNNDVIGQFIEDRMERDETSTSRILVNKLFTDFKNWAFQVIPRGKKVPDRNQLRAYMEKEFGIYPGNGKGWKGIRIKNSGEGAGAGGGVDSDVD
jgi:P4 family phage/plasmid primase-like protien